MKKLTLLIVFSLTLIYLAGFAFAAPLPPDPSTCDMKFTDRDGETRSADSWCTDCPDGPYDFCVGDRHYQFGCESGGFFGTACNCDPDSVSLETCTESCNDWDCAAGSGCAWGSCEQTPEEPEPPEDANGGDSGNGGQSGSRGQGYTGELEPPIKAKTFEELINNIINFVFWIGVAVAPVMILIAGIMLMTAGGDTVKLGKAKTLILYTVIGFAIILFAKGLIAVLQSILGTTG